MNTTHSRRRCQLQIATSPARSLPNFFVQSSFPAVLRSPAYVFSRRTRHSMYQRHYTTSNLRLYPCSHCQVSHVRQWKVLRDLGRVRGVVIRSEESIQQMLPVDLNSQLFTLFFSSDSRWISATFKYKISTALGSQRMLATSGRRFTKRHPHINDWALEKSRNRSCFHRC